MKGKITINDGEIKEAIGQYFKLTNVYYSHVAISVKIDWRNRVATVEYLPTGATPLPSQRGGEEKEEDRPSKPVDDFSLH
jgi:hypothetical protein